MYILPLITKAIERGYQAPSNFAVHL